jgi:hypothetical protein
MMIIKMMIAEKNISLIKVCFVFAYKFLSKQTNNATVDEATLMTTTSILIAYTDSI